MSASKIEPFWWLLFSAGGMLSALFLPGHIVFQGIALPFGWLSEEATSYARMQALLAHPIAKLYLFALISLSLFHGGHRLKHTIYDLGLRAMAPLAFLCYGLAIVGTVVLGVALLRI
jgi:fumarate reductase subunit D